MMETSGLCFIFGAKAVPILTPNMPAANTTRTGVSGSVSKASFAVRTPLTLKPSCSRTGLRQRK